MARVFVAAVRAGTIGTGQPRRACLQVAHEILLVSAGIGAAVQHTQMGYSAANSARRKSSASCSGVKVEALMILSR